MLFRGRLDGAEYAFVLGISSAMMALWVLVNYLFAATPYLYEGLRYARPVALSFYGAALVVIVIRRLRDAGVGIRPLFEHGVAAATYWRLIYLCITPAALIATLWNGRMTALQAAPALAWLMSIAFFADVSPPHQSRRDWTALLVKIILATWLPVEIVHEVLWRNTPIILGDVVRPDDITALVKLGVICALAILMIAAAFAEWTRHQRPGRQSPWAKAFVAVAGVGVASTVAVTALFCLLPFTGTLIRGVSPEFDDRTIVLIMRSYSTAANIQLAALALAPLLVGKMLSGTAARDLGRRRQRQDWTGSSDQLTRSVRPQFGQR